MTWEFEESKARIPDIFSHLQTRIVRPLMNVLFRGLILGSAIVSYQAVAEPAYAAKIVDTENYTQCGVIENGAVVKRHHVYFVRKDTLSDGRVKFRKPIDLQIQPGLCGVLNYGVPFSKTVDPKTSFYLGQKPDPNNPGTIGEYWMRSDGVKGFINDRPIAPSVWYKMSRMFESYQEVSGQSQ